MPLVIFLYGYTATDPEISHAWIEHLVRRGAIVLYPDWQPWDYRETDNAEILPVILAKADDPIVGTEPARLWSRLSSIPLENRDFIAYVDDAHGAPALESSHDLPATTLFNPLDDYDWDGTWRWLDALMTCSFANKDCEFALGNTPEQRFMGTWSDGVPVAEPIITDDPSGA